MFWELSYPWREELPNSDNFLVCRFLIRSLFLHVSGEGAAGFMEKCSPHPQRLLCHLSKVCSPHYAQGRTSMSHCVEVTLLRLQSMWASKIITSGLLIPAGYILSDRRAYNEFDKVISKLTILLAYAMIASGHLPVVVLLIPLATLGESLLALSSWSNGRFKITSYEDVAVLSTITAQALAATVQLVLQKLFMSRPLPPLWMVQGSSSQHGSNQPDQLCCAPGQYAISCKVSLFGSSLAKVQMKHLLFWLVVTAVSS